MDPSKVHLIKLFDIQFIDRGGSRRMSKDQLNWKDRVLNGWESKTKREN